MFEVGEVCSIIWSFQLLSSNPVYKYQDVLKASVFPGESCRHYGTCALIYRSSVMLASPTSLGI